MNLSQKDRLAYREQVARELGVLLDPPLSFRAAKFAAQHKTRADLVKWLKHENTRNCWQMGRKTYVELCMAFGLAVPAKAPKTLGAQLAAAKARIAELEAALKDICENNSIFGADARDIAKESLCSGGNGGKSTYQNGFTGATTSLPPETRITVNGKTFTLGEIDKEMTQ